MAEHLEPWLEASEALDRESGYVLPNGQEGQKPPVAGLDAAEIKPFKRSIIPNDCHPERFFQTIHSHPVRGTQKTLHATSACAVRHLFLEAATCDHGDSLRHSVPELLGSDFFCEVKEQNNCLYRPKKTL